MRVLFRADSSLEIGSGHVRRCLALAEALSKKDASCLFVARALPGNVNALVTSSRHRLIELPGGMSAPESDAAGVSAAVAALAPFDLLVVDHYSLGEEWERALRPLARHVAAIDDLADRRHDCDTLIDVTPGDGRAAVYEGLLPPQALALLGPRYAMLRPEFQSLRGARRARTGTIQRVLIGFGAVDQANHSHLALKAVRHSCGSEVDVDMVLGGNAPHRSMLAAAIRSDPRARLHIDTPDMAGLMAAADLAIGAGGTTSWERACLGLPAIVTTIAENQREIVQALVESGAAISVPDGDGYEARLSEMVASLATDPPRLVEMSGAAALLVDGRGAERLATMLLRPHVVLRAAAEDDRHDLWRWRNEPDVRMASNTTEPIGWERHSAWFDAVLGDPGRRLLIGEVAGAAVGVVRLDVAGDDATISIHLTPPAHGRGIGPELLMQAQLWLQRNLPGTKRINAQIRGANTASIAAFAAARYRRRTGEHYVRELPHDAAKPN